MGSGETWEAESLDEEPSLRAEITASRQFRDWRASLPTFHLDGETFFLPWGDVPMDEDQIAYHWARERGLIGPQTSDDGARPNVDHRARSDGHET